MDFSQVDIVKDFKAVTGSQNSNRDIAGFLTGFNWNLGTAINAFFDGKVIQIMEEEPNQGFRTTSRNHGTMIRNNVSQLSEMGYSRDNQGGEEARGELENRRQLQENSIDRTPINAFQLLRQGSLSQKILKDSIQDCRQTYEEPVTSTLENAKMELISEDVGQGSNRLLNMYEDQNGKVEIQNLENYKPELDECEAQELKNRKKKQREERSMRNKNLKKRMSKQEKLDQKNTSFNSLLQRIEDLKMNNSSVSPIPKTNLYLGSMKSYIKTNQHIINNYILQKGRRLKFLPFTKVKNDTYRRKLNSLQDNPVNSKETIIMDEQSNFILGIW